ncbi:MAG: hypothetical protein IJL32_03390 [Oscillospiraceae bacterium]|nr:hypothetical protein [Oscillospiraceae bacterium]
MKQKLTEQELCLLQNVQNDLDIAVKNYPCTITRDQLLSKGLQRSANPVRPEDAELFFSGVLPAGWNQTYFKEPNAVADFLKSLRKLISVIWVEEYVEQELRGLKRCTPLKREDISLSRMKADLGYRQRKEDMLESHEMIESYLRELRKRADIAPDFRFIPPNRFAEIVVIYLDAMEERGDCTQKQLGDFLGMAQSSVSKFRTEKKNIPTETEYRLLLAIAYLLTWESHNISREFGSGMQRCIKRSCIDLQHTKINRDFASAYLAVLLRFQLFDGKPEKTHTPASVAQINQLLEKRGFSERFDPDAKRTFSPIQTEKTESGTISLYTLIRKPDDAVENWECNTVVDEIMKMDAAYLRILYQAPEVFFNDLISSPGKTGNPYVFLSEMRALKPAGFNYLIEKLEDLPISGEVLSYGSKVYLTRKRSAFLRDFYQVMVFLTDYSSQDCFRKAFRKHPLLISCDLAVAASQQYEKQKLLKGKQEQEYRRQFEFYASEFGTAGLLEKIRLKFSMTIPEWRIWLQMELLGFHETDDEKLQAFMTECLDEAREVDRLKSDPDADAEQSL